MFAVVRTGGKQYRVAPGDKIVVEKLAGDAGDTVTLGDVLVAGSGGDLKSTDGLTVEAEIIAQAKGEKVIVFKKRRRHNYRRKNGHRQQHTILRIVAVGGERAQQSGGTAVQAPVAAGDDAGAEAAPARKTRARKAAPEAAEAQPAAPLKVEGLESAMVDAPAPDAVAGKDA